MAAARGGKGPWPGSDTVMVSPTLHSSHWVGPLPGRTETGTDKAQSGAQQ